MQTTLRLDDNLYREVKSEAARAGVSITLFIEEALRLRLTRRAGTATVEPSAPELPVFTGRNIVNVPPEKLKQLFQDAETPRL